jgi:hypothetical protein
LSQGVPEQPARPHFTKDKSGGKSQIPNPKSETWARDEHGEFTVIFESDPCFTFVSSVAQVSNLGFGIWDLGFGISLFQFAQGGTDRATARHSGKHGSNRGWFRIPQGPPRWFLNVNHSRPAGQSCLGLGCRTHTDQKFHVQSQVSDFGFRISDFGFRISDFGFRISDLTPHQIAKKTSR